MNAGVSLVTAEMDRFAKASHFKHYRAHVCIRARDIGLGLPWFQQGFIQKITYEGAITAILTLKSGCFISCILYI